MWEVDNIQEAAATTMEVNGDVRNIEAGANLKEVVIGTARDAGFGKFRFYINGEEVLPQNAPVLIEDGKAYKIAPFDVAGGNTL
jgi:hypothetical protein